MISETFFDEWLTHSADCSFIETYYSETNYHLHEYFKINLRISHYNAWTLKIYIAYFSLILMQMRFSQHFHNIFRYGTGSRIIIIMKHLRYGETKHLNHERHYKFVLW